MHIVFVDSLVHAMFLFFDVVPCLIFTFSWLYVFTPFLKRRGKVDVPVRLSSADPVIFCRNFPVLGENSVRRMGTLNPRFRV